MGHHYTIIGNGIAGIRAAEEIRNREAEAEITIISAESDHCFSRTALMYVFCGQLSWRDIEPRERDHYARMRFRRVRDRVVSLDGQGRTLKLSSGTTMPFDRLLLALGSKPRKHAWPGADLDGIGHFVTLQDLAWLEQEVYGKTTIERERSPASEGGDDFTPYRIPRRRAFRDGKVRRAAIIGGGLIGIEAFEILHKAGVETHMLAREQWYWPIALDQTEAQLIKRHVEHHPGCTLHLTTDVESFLGNDKGQLVAMKTKQGQEMPVDLAVVTIGVAPNTDFLENSGIALDQVAGIVVNQNLETNIQGVWAAGDCASVRWFNGTSRPEQLWYTARDQGTVAGRNMLGDGLTYERGLLYNSAKFFDIEYTTAGLVNWDLPGEENWYQEDAERNRSLRVTHQNGRVVGFNALGCRYDHEVWLRWIRERRSLDYALRHMGESAFDAEFTRPYLPNDVPQARPKGLLSRLFGGGQG
jgi:NAD(P)H-nitrite reductase large subunit